MKGEYILGYANWLDLNKPGIGTGAFIKKREHEVRGKEFILRASLVNPGGPMRHQVNGYFVYYKNDPNSPYPVFSFVGIIFKEYMLECKNAERFKKQLNESLNDKDKA